MPKNRYTCAIWSIELRANHQNHRYASHSQIFEGQCGDQPDLEGRSEFEIHLLEDQAPQQKAAHLVHWICALYADSTWFKIDNTKLRERYARICKYIYTHWEIEREWERGGAKTKYGVYIRFFKLTHWDNNCAIFSDINATRWTD